MKCRRACRWLQSGHAVDDPPCLDSKFDRHLSRGVDSYAQIWEHELQDPPQSHQYLQQVLPGTALPLQQFVLNRTSSTPPEGTQTEETGGGGGQEGLMHWALTHWV